MACQQFVSGNLTIVEFGIMPDENICEKIEPVDVVVDLTVPVVLSDTTLTVTALTGPVAAGTELVFDDSGTEKKVFTTSSAATGATSITIEASTVAIADTATCTYDALIALIGGTTSTENIANNDESFSIYGDGIGLNFDEGVITSAAWSIDYDFNLLPLDDGFRRLLYASQNAITGVAAYIRKLDPLGAGATTKKSIAGVVQVSDFSQENPADGVISGSLTFVGRGAPVFVNAAE